MNLSHANPSTIESNILPSKEVFLSRYEWQESEPAACLENQYKSYHQQSILVIDSDPSLINLAIGIFEMSGLTAYGFTNPRKAIAWYETHSADVALTFLDMKMPQMSGQKCFYELKNINFNAEIVLASNVLEQNIVNDLLRNGAVRFFQKPFDYQTLVYWTLQRLTGTDSTTSQSPSLTKAA